MRGISTGSSRSVIVAGTDGVARDVDVVVRDSSGNVVAGDTDDDAVPIVMFAGDDTETYSMTVSSAQSAGTSMVTTLVLEIQEN